MADAETDAAAPVAVTGPPPLTSFDHVSLPCRDLEEGIRFYRDVLGGEMTVHQEAFAQFRLGGVKIGIGSVGTTFMTPAAEYPHIAFDVDADTLVRMRDWLHACGIPTSNLWTRQGVETLMFFRDPSGNVLELYCYQGHPEAPDLPRGPARGHGTATDVDALAYDRWSLPDTAG